MLRCWGGNHHRVDIFSSQQLSVRRAELHVVLLRQRAGAVPIHIADHSERTQLRKVANQIFSPISTSNHSNSWHGLHLLALLSLKLGLTTLLSWVFAVEI